MPNRLIREASPYLQQHAHNPVDWYPWGDEALDRSRAEDRPILLSVGYSACHWCHVMERESFEDPETAALMNERFVNVKVDREERPDVDQVYMRAVQTLTGGGGWPLTVFLTPGGEPYYGGTYFPPRPVPGRPSFRQVLEAVSEAYRNRTEEVRAAATTLVEAVRRTGEPAPATADDGGPDGGLLDQATRALERTYDPVHGGFGGAPKFPQPTTLELLLRQHARTGSKTALTMALHTLDRMAAGGMRDHLGGGFHRYSVDAAWRVPHFEKMLYDNALLARAYTDAYRVTGRPELRATAEHTLDYVLTDLTAPEGGFYAARDADSEGVEGLFYVWTYEEVVGLLEPDEADLFCRAYDVTPGGNVEGRNVLHRPHGLDGSVGSTDKAVGDRDVILERCRDRLLEARGLRTAPFRDEKVLASWSAFTVRALAEAGASFARPDYLEAARSAIDFMRDTMVVDGRVRHAWTAGRTGDPGFLEDAAALGNAALSLHEATLEGAWLDVASSAAHEVVDGFWSDDEGVFHDTHHGAEALVVRPRDPTDSPTPSGTSLAVELLLRLGHVCGVDRYEEIARRALRADSATMLRFPGAFGRLLSCVGRADAPPLELVVVGELAARETRLLLREAWRRYLPDLAITGGAPSDHPDLPLLEGRSAVTGVSTAYLCRDQACQLPVTTANALAGQLDEVQ